MAKLIVTELNGGNGGLTFGHVVCYAAEEPDPHTIQHEQQHVYQSNEMGNMYLFIHLAAGLRSMARAAGENNPDPWHAYNPIDPTDENGLPPAGWGAW